MKMIPKQMQKKLFEKLRFFFGLCLWSRSQMRCNREMEERHPEDLSKFTKIDSSWGKTREDERKEEAATTCKYGDKE